MSPVIATRRDLAGALPGLRRTLSHIRPHLRRERFLVAGGFAALFAEVVFRLLEPWPLKVVVDAVIEPGASERPDMERLLVLAGVAVVAAVALRALMSYLTTVAFALAGNRVLTRVRADLFDHVQRLSVVQHSQQRVGDLVTRLTGDVGRLQEVAVTAGLPLLGNVVTLVGMTAVMAWIDLRLTLVVMIAFPLFLAAESTLGWADTAETMAYVFGIPGLVLAWYSAVLYVPMGRRALQEGRQDAASEIGGPGVPSSP